MARGARARVYGSSTDSQLGRAWSHSGIGWLFQGLDINIAPRDRLALIGRNGAGKSTILKLIAGTIDADKGKRSVQPGTRVITLEQDPFSPAARR
jgi:ATPase subunit of ABC transporter with duplicated ATPase domains